MAWEVQLVGDSTDLRLLSESLTSGDPQIVVRDGAFFLRTAAFESAPTASVARERAQVIADSLSGSASLLLGTRQPIRLGNVIQVGSDGSQHIFLFAHAANAHARALPATVTLTHADGRREVYRPADPAPAWLTKAATNPAVAKALRLRQRQPLDWVGLYRLLEVITAVAPIPTIVARGWASKADLALFKHTANSARALGDEARHGADTTQPPAKAMTLPQARLVIDSILRSWLDSDLT
jgi:hypothetical protein